MLITPTVGPRGIHRDMGLGGAPGRVPDARPLPLAVRRTNRHRSARIDSHNGILTVPGRGDGYIDFRGTGELITWTRETPPEWTAQLRALSPKSDEHGWLELVWEAGDRWIIGQRWTLYEMLHEQFVDAEILAELNGDHPRSQGHMCSTKVPDQFQCLCRRKRESWRGGPAYLITLTQWHLWRRTGYYGKPFWIVQGDRGGHKFSFTEQEREMLRLADKPGNPPALGDLPYAPFDELVAAQIVRRNRLAQLGQTLGAFRRTMGEGYAQHKAALSRELRAEYVKWFTDYNSDVNDLFLTAARNGAMDNEHRTSIDYDRVDEIATGQFLETGNLPSARAVQATHRKLY